ncbi:hypothetical protein AMTRI_Chr11g156110 [Amborella trichopoda]|uniref:Prolamin-like domain-containing protein n=1 Tax=Amborella trichopoda TaxID=13333 RepID=W1PNI1_AMBTC|nr:egg cell-secreted protein 1.4 [Amborella trichopoda]ERN08715.1 hypothetical protein AMTR_s00017p00235360 [Amborella trichopoda]|eukprot:XP_006847134.1 egg cell-secreted protein 1.4 [Amborella trichopoda]
MASYQLPAILLILAVLMAASVAPVAQAQSASASARPAEFSECFSALWDKVGFWQEVYNFYTTGKNFPGVDCCKASLEVGAQCWLTFWVPGGLSPALISKLKSYCTAFVARSASGPAPAPGKSV